MKKSTVTRNACKQYAPLSVFFVTDVLYNWLSQFKIKLHKCMKKKFILEIVAFFFTN